MRNAGGPLFHTFYVVPSSTAPITTSVWLDLYKSGQWASYDYVLEWHHVEFSTQLHVENKDETIDTFGSIATELPIAQEDDDLIETDLKTMDGKINIVQKLTESIIES
ncbi:unnamed protein product, partial [Didymodactylos carnosus]